MTEQSASTQSNQPRLRVRDAAGTFASFGLTLAMVTFVVSIFGAFGAFRSNAETATGDGSGGANSDRVVATDDGAVADPAARPQQIVASSAEAMGAVSSVEFRLERSGAPIFIDAFEKIALDSLRGQFTVPTRAQAELSVTVDGNLATRLGAVAIDDEVWISNPVTGDFETLPAGYDIDPSQFFDPQDGWRPLLASLQQVTLVGVDDRGGDRYHIRGTAPAERIGEITVGLVRDQDVPIDFWIHPGTFLVTAVEFATTIDSEETRWKLELARFGDSFVIEPPANVRPTDTSTTGE